MAKSSKKYKKKDSNKSLCMLPCSQGVTKERQEEVSDWRKRATGVEFQSKSLREQPLKMNFSEMQHVLSKVSVLH